MQNAEDKLARELGFRVNEKGRLVYPVCDKSGQPIGFSSGFASAEQVESLWRKCLELTERNEELEHRMGLTAGCHVCGKQAPRYERIALLFCKDHHGEFNKLKDQVRELTEQRGGMSAKEWLETWVDSKLGKGNRPCGWPAFGSVSAEEVARMLEAYASSRLAARQDALETHLPPGFDIGDEATAELAVKLVASESRLAEVSAQLADAVMFLRIVLTRKDVTTLNCLKPKIADWLKRTGNEGSILREVKMSTSGIHEECETCGKPRWAHRKEKMCTEIVKTDEVKELLSAVYCLNLEVDPSIAEDVRRKAEAVIAENATLRAERDALEDADKRAQEHFEAWEQECESNRTLRAELERLKKLIEEVKQEITEEPTIGRTVDILFREPLEKAEAENRELNATVARLTGERDALQRKVKAFEVLSGSPKGMLEFCQANGLEHMKPQPTMDTWRKSIVEWANQ